MEDDLLQGSCYICQEPCHEKSPCECEAYVHYACLQKFIDISDNSVCTICKTKVVEDSDSDSDDEEPYIVIQQKIPLQLCVLIVFSVYFVMGIIGQLIVQSLKHEEVNHLFMFWSGKFFVYSSIASGCLILPIYIIIRIIQIIR